jgi:hypothetical protein
MKRVCIFSFFILFTSVLQVEALLNKRQPLIWDIQSIKRLSDTEKQKIIEEADAFCEEDPVIITNKNISFEPNKHYFCSIGPYWWPDSATGRYIRKDGLVNPESKRYDNVKLGELAKRCRILSFAFYYSREKKYYKIFVKQLKAWFVDRHTYMYPNFEYSQIIPGQNGNKGRSAGMITAYNFNTVIESIRLVNSVKRIDKKTLKSLQTWFFDFAKWAENCEYNEKLRKSKDNIGLAYDVILINMYLFSDNENKAKLIADSFEEKRINQQIKIDGSQPAELRRSRSFSYSIYNLSHMIDFCFLVRFWYPDYYQQHGERIKLAFNFLEKYINDNTSFPYQQITSWEDCREDYWEQVERLEVLQTR